MEVLQDGALQLHLTLTTQQIAQFQHYYELLLEGNQRSNLTRITGEEDVQRRHFLDSLSALPILAETVSAEESGDPIAALLRRPLHAIDVGSGAGLPGVPWAIVWPKLKLTLLDGTAKKVSFLQNVIKELPLPAVQALQGRAEEVGRDSCYRGQYDLVIARALAPLPTLVEYLLPLCRHGGWMVAYKGPAVTDELPRALKAISILGGEVIRLAPVTVPGLEASRFLLLVRKVKRTPRRYPRGSGKPRNQPLL